MIENINPTPIGIAAAVVFVLAWIVFYFALTPPRSRRRELGQILPVVEEAATNHVPAPWSPTRGFYWFPASGLPEPYLGLAGVQEGAVFKELGEDEADALARLNGRLAKRLLDERRQVAPAAAVASIRFQPLNKRKKDRTP